MPRMIRRAPLVSQGRRSVKLLKPMADDQAVEEVQKDEILDDDSDLVKDNEEDIVSMSFDDQMSRFMGIEHQVGSRTIPQNQRDSGVIQEDENVVSDTDSRASMTSNGY